MRIAVVVLAGALLLAGCGGSAAPTAAPPSATTVVARTATEDLAPFVAAAGRVDARLRAAAGLVNGGVTTGGLQFTAAMADAVAAAAPSGVVASIPAGLPPTLLRPVLLVYSELEARWRAMNRVQPGVVIEHSDDPLSRYQEVVRCLGNGAVPAARFPGDLAALERLAATSPPVDVARPDSRPAAELAVRIESIVLQNAGCGSCGGTLFPELDTVTWDGPSTGRIRSGPADVQFRVSYDAAGWHVVVMAC